MHTLNYTYPPHIHQFLFIKSHCDVILLYVQTLCFLPIVCPQLLLNKVVENIEWQFSVQWNRV